MPTTDYVVEGREDFGLPLIRRVGRAEIDTSSSDFSAASSETIASSWAPDSKHRTPEKDGANPLEYWTIQLARIFHEVAPRPW